MIKYDHRLRKISRCVVVYISYFITKLLICFCRNKSGDIEGCEQHAGTTGLSTKRCGQDEDSSGWPSSRGEQKRGVQASPA